MEHWCEQPHKGVKGGGVEGGGRGRGGWGGGGGLANTIISVLCILKMKRMKCWNVGYCYW